MSSLCQRRVCASQDVEYTSGILQNLISEGNSVVNWFCKWASVKRSFEVGTPIRITHRIIARNETSNFIIAFSNIRVCSKSKDNVDIQVVLVLIA